MTGTVVKANRKEIGILVLFDGDEQPVAYRHDDVINRVDDMTDLLDGRGVRVGMRVEEVREPDGPRLRLTGESFAAEPDPDPSVARGNVTPAGIHAAAMRGTNQQRIDEFFRFQGPPRDTDTDEELLYGK